MKLRRSLYPLRATSWRCTSCSCAPTAARSASSWARFGRNRLASEVLGRVCRDIASGEASGEVAARRAAVVTAATTYLRGGEPIGGPADPGEAELVTSDRAGPPSGGGATASQEEVHTHWRNAAARNERAAVDASLPRGDCTSDPISELRTIRRCHVRLRDVGGRAEANPSAIGQGGDPLGPQHLWELAEHAVELLQPRVAATPPSPASSSCRWPTWTRSAGRPPASPTPPPPALNRSSPRTTRKLDAYQRVAERPHLDAAAGHFIC
jgi:hypothetical protein